MAVRFDAAESYNVTLTLGSQSAYSFTCWAYLATDRNNYSAVWSFDSNLDGTAFILQTDVDGTTMKVYDDNVGNFVATGPNMSTGTWYFFGVTVSGTSGTLYYRTASASTLTTATWTGAARTITRLLIGDDRYTEWLNGRVAAHKFWTASLTQAEIERESLQYVPHRTANLQTFYPFVRAETTDYSGNARTLSGGATTTTEDGPPIPWVGRSPRIILPAAVSGTNANAENVAFTVAGQDAASTVASSPENVTLAVTAQDAASNVKPSADVAGLTVTANNLTALVNSGVEGVTFAVAALDGALTVKPSAEVVTFSVSALDATVSTATTTNAPAESAAVALAAQDATAATAPVAAEASAAVAGMDASIRAAASAESVSAAVVAQDPQASIRSSAEAVSMAFTANDATVIVGTIVNAECATFGLSANDATASGQSSANAAAQCATFGMSALDATVITGRLAQAECATFGFAANDIKLSLLISAEVAEIQAFAYDGQTSQPSGHMSVADVTGTSMIRLTQPTAEAIGMSRTGATATVTDAAGSSMGVHDAV